jgi:hypothetical protein
MFGDKGGAVPRSLRYQASTWWMFFVLSAAWLSAVILFAAGSPLPAVLVLAGAALFLRTKVKRIQRQRPGRRRSGADRAARSVEPRAEPVRVVRFDRPGPGGRIDGVVVAGPHAGRVLRDLPLDAMLAVAASIDAGDVGALERMTALLDELHPGWSGDTQPAADGGADPDVIGLEAARRLLGVDARATPDEICAAHRRIIRRVHPDVGGSAVLTAEVNAAKDLLLSVA